MARMPRNEHRLGERGQPPTLTIPGNQIFPYLKANGQDQVADLIRLSSETYRHSSVENFCLDLRLHPPTNARSYRSSTHDFLGWEVYYFDICDCAIALEVRLLPPPLSTSGRPLALPTVEVAFDRHWLPIPTFLDIFTPACHIRARHFQQTAEARCKDQSRWWKALSNLPVCNPQHKVFRLMALPAEIRELIYGYVFPSPLHPFPGAKCRQRSGLVLMHFKAAQPNISILRLNRQIYEEARRVLLSDTVWQIQHLTILNRVLSSDVLHARIQRLHLALSHERFIRLFTAETEFSIANLKSLREMKLKELILDFAPPPSLYGQYGWNAEAVDGPLCQRLVVDSILQAAQSWIVGHEGVCVVGWAKKNQKETFEGLCKAGVKEFAKWKAICGNPGAELAEWDEWKEELMVEEDGGVRVVEAKVEDMVEGEGDEMQADDQRTIADFNGWSLPECFCEPSCGREKWSAED